jgi:hypothetical protein
MEKFSFFHVKNARLLDWTRHCTRIWFKLPVQVSHGTCSLSINHTMSTAPNPTQWYNPWHSPMVLIPLLLGEWTPMTVTKNSTQQGPSWQTNTSSASQEIPCILQNPKFHYCVHKRPCPEPDKSSLYPPIPFLILPPLPSLPSSITTIFMCAIPLCLKSNYNNNINNSRAAQLQILLWCLFNCHFTYSYTTCFGTIFAIMRCILSESFIQVIIQCHLH